jgi:hypothetical protein
LKATINEEISKALKDEKRNKIWVSYNIFKEKEKEEEREN